MIHELIYQSGTNGRVIINRREIDTIEHMRDLDGKGFNYWKIAEILNSMAVPTKSWRAKWQAAPVMKIIKSADKPPQE